MWTIIRLIVSPIAVLVSVFIVTLAIPCIGKDVHAYENGTIERTVMRSGPDYDKSIPTLGLGYSNQSEDFISGKRSLGRSHWTAHTRNPGRVKLPGSAITRNVVRSVTRTGNNLKRSMRNITNSMRRMNTSINRIRTYRRRF